MDLKPLYQDRLDTYKSGDYSEVFERKGLENEAAAIYKIKSVLEEHSENIGWYLYGEPKITKEINGTFTVEIPLAKSKDFNMGSFRR